MSECALVSHTFNSIVLLPDFAWYLILFHCVTYFVVHANVYFCERLTVNPFSRTLVSFYYSHSDLVCFHIIIYSITYVNSISGITHFEHLFYMYCLRHYLDRTYRLLHNFIMGSTILTRLFVQLFGFYSIRSWLMSARIIFCV